MAEPIALVEVPLHRVAHARTGDKGDRINVSLFPYLAETFQHLQAQVDEARVLAVYRHKGAVGVRRHVLENLGGLNFVVDRVLEGGVNGSLNLDGHGKSFSFLLLGLTVRVPRHVVRGA